jgi:hypothetical protein
MAPQRVKVEAGNVHFLGPDGNIKTIQANNNSGVKPGIDLAGFPAGPQIRQRLALERLDHGRM